MQRRTIPDPGFAGDSGEADPALAAALAAHAQDPGRLPDVLAALHGARVLVPVVAVLGEAGRGGRGLTVDKSADIALPLLQEADGSRAVPVFSSLAAQARWDPQARPVPVPAARAAAVAVAEGAVAMLVDLAGPHPAGLGPAELHALRDRRGLVPAYDDETLRVAIHQALAPVGEVEAAWLGPCPGADARLTVRVRSGAALEPLARRLSDPLRAALRAAGGGVRGTDLALQRHGDAAPPGRAVFKRSPGHRQG